MHIILVREHSVFTLDEERKFNMLFGKDQLNDQSYINVQLDDIAKQVKIERHYSYI
jgi:syntaxin-binding protein 1